MGRSRNLCGMFLIVYDIMKTMSMSFARDIMSVSEREQAKPIHREWQMVIMSFAHNIIRKGCSSLSDIILTNHTCSSMTVISNLFLDTYLPKASGEAIKVYLLLLRYAGAGQSITLSILAEKLNQTEESIRESLSYWEKMGLLHITMDQMQTILSMQLLPIPAVHTQSVEKKINSVGQIEYKTSLRVPEKKTLAPKEIDDNLSSDRLSQLIFVTETYLGKQLTNADLNTLFYFHDSLGFSEDLIEFLVEHCVSMNKTSFRYLETVAIAWYEAGIKTVKEAKASVKTHNKNYYSIMKTFGISGRNPGKIEMEYIDKWLDKYGFPLPIILEACNRTLKAIQQPSFPYADRILTDWKKTGAMSMETITKLDSERKNSKKQVVDKKGVASVMKSSTNNKFHNFEQRTYDYQELEQRFINKANGIPTDYIQKEGN